MTETKKPSPEQMQVASLIMACDKVLEMVQLQANEVQELRIALVLLMNEFDLPTFEYIRDRLFKVLKKEGVKPPKTRKIGFSKEKFIKGL